jgi:hypothetical protein
MPMKTKMMYHLTSVRTATIKKGKKISIVKYVEKRNPLNSVGENINKYIYYGK